MYSIDIYKEKMLSKKIWAVVGVTAKKHRYGYKIWESLKNHGYKTYGVNPNYDEIEGTHIYKSLSELPEKIDVVNFIVPPNISLKLLNESKELGIDYLWFQPGSFDEKTLNEAMKMEFKVVYCHCVYEELKKIGN